MEKLPRRSNDVIEWIGVLPLELADAVAELGESDAFEDFHDGVANLFHHAADATDIFVGAGTLLVKFFADATDGCERAFDEADDAGECDFIRREAQAITAGYAAAAFENAGGAQVVEDLFEETLGNVLLVGDGLDANDFFVGVEAKHDQSAESIFTSERQLHWRRT
jgi:hypothetical protein